MHIHVTLEDLSQVKKRMQVEVPAEAGLEEFNRVARELQRRVRVPGFRVGKAPLGLVKQHYRSDIRDEVLNQLVPRSYEQAVMEKSLKPLGKPRLEDLDFQAGLPLRYSADFEIEPEFELPRYKGLKLDASLQAVTEEDLRRELDSLRERQSVLEPVESRSVQDGDFVAVRLEGDFIWDDEPPPKPPRPIREDDVLVEVGAKNTHRSFSEALLGMRTSEEKEFEVSYAPDYQEEALAGRRVRFRIVVNDVKKKVLPELTDEFAKDVGDYDSVEALRKEIREQLERRAHARLQADREDDLLRQLTEAVDFEVPEILVEEQIDAKVRRLARDMASHGVNPMRAEMDWVQFRQDVRPNAVLEVRSDLILERVADKEDVKVSQEDIEEELQNLAEAAGQPVETVRQWIGRENRLEDMVGRLRKKKTLDFLVESAAD